MNAVWPTELPELTEYEAVRAARKLWRWGMGDTWGGKIVITTGNRHTWRVGDALRVNAEGGWDRFVHDMSHLMWYYANSDVKSHEKDHAKLELRMRKLVLRRGWLNGALKQKPKTEKPPVDPKVQKLHSIEARIARWQSKHKRAAHALAKLEKQRRRLEKTAAQQ